MDKALEGIVSCYSDAMAMSLQLLTQSDEGLHITTTAHDLNDNVQVDTP